MALLAFSKQNLIYILKVRKGIVTTSARKTEHIKGQKGIWYDASDKSYFVGDLQALANKQARSHQVRRFDIYTGEKYFNYEILLESLAVLFVRNKQYTVYPFFFDLINLSLDNRVEQVHSLYYTFHISDIDKS